MTILSLLSTLPAGSSSTQPTKSVSSEGFVHYSPFISVKINQDSEIGLNNLSLGFQLDGYDIRRFRDRSALRDLAKQVNFKLVRFFHHRLGSASGSGSVPCSKWNEDTQTGVWDGWNKVDPLIERIFEIGAEPLICFGYYSLSMGKVSVPEGMQTDGEGFPRSQTWANYCVEWLRHFKSKGYPVRFFEIINEPYQMYFWKDESKLANYVRFWNTVAEAMRQENPDIFISSDCTTIRHVLDYWTTSGENVDFLGFHKYDSGRTYYSDEELFERAETFMFVEGDSEFPCYSIDEARKKWETTRGDTLPVICGESNLNWKSPTDPRIQTMTGAVWTSLAVRSGILEGLNYFLYWNLAGTSDAENFGMINGLTNEPYYSYYVLRMVGSNLDTGDNLIKATTSSDAIRALAWINQEHLNLLIINKEDSSRTITLNGLEGQLQFQKVDNTEPTLQTETIDATEPLVLEGYTVVLLQAET